MQDCHVRTSRYCPFQRNLKTCSDTLSLIDSLLRAQIILSLGLHHSTLKRSQYGKRSTACALSITQHYLLPLWFCTPPSMLSQHQADKCQGKSTLDCFSDWLQLVSCFNSWQLSRRGFAIPDRLHWVYRSLFRIYSP